MDLPKGVERVVSRGKPYYYWNPGRGTRKAGQRTRLADPERYPRVFFAEVDELARQELVYPAGSVGALIKRYRDSGDFKGLADKTRQTYGVHLRRFEAPEAWGFLQARDLAPIGVLAARDALEDVPVMANQMLTVGRTVWSWAVPLALVDDNPFAKVKNLKVKDRGHVPWPYWAVAHVIEHAPGDLVRMVELGRMTCQRESDLIRMGPQHRERTGLWCRPQKTTQRRRSFFIPLAAADGLALDRWPSEPITFENRRWKAPAAIARDDFFLFSPRGAPYSTSSLRARWGRWLSKTPAGKDLAKRWREWLKEKVAQYEWEIEPDDQRGPTIHGLRGSGILLRLAAGYDRDQIANDVGMSRPMVDHYMRFKDQLEVAAAGPKRLRLIGG